MWLALVILIFYIPFLLLINFLSSESVLDKVDLADDPVGLVELAAVIVSLAGAIWALVKRKRWGRWLVAASLAYMIGTLLWGHFVFADEDPVYKTRVLLGASVGLSPLIIVILLTSFGAEIKKYFGERPNGINSE